MGNIKIKREMKLSTYLCLIGAPAADSGAANSSNNNTAANDSLAPANGTGADNGKGGNGMVIAIVVILAVLGAAGGVCTARRVREMTKELRTPRKVVIRTTSTRS